MGQQNREISPYFKTKKHPIMVKIMPPKELARFRNTFASVVYSHVFKSFFSHFYSFKKIIYEDVGRYYVNNRLGK